ncbi:MAG TPA: sigma-70 family RNA polymerase sigma factor [Thermoanaerobaculia bacterium]|nr:sigma-70 family RNA polymerase sigma factor [Thermoanaerobaculia bacterium]
MSAAPLLKASPTALPASLVGRELLEAHFDLIQRKLQHLSRRSGLPDSEAEEYRSWALFKLVENDYRILGSWEGRSSFPTFLKVVLVNLLRDYRIHIWGKWRPSAASRRRGLEGVLLDRLMVRDGLSGDEAAERLRTEHGISPAPDELVRLTAVLPRRQERQSVSEEELLQIPVDGQVEIRIEEKERACAAKRLRELLVPLLRALPAEDRILLRLCFFEGLSMAAIAPILGRPQRELYKVRERCLRKIRRSLVEAGLSSDQIRGLLGRLQGDLGLERSLEG